MEERIELLLKSPKFPSTKLVGRNVAKYQMGLAKAVNLFHYSEAQRIHGSGIRCMVEHAV